MTPRMVEMAPWIVPTYDPKDGGDGRLYSKVPTYDPEDGGDSPLYDGQPEAVEAALHSFVRSALAVQVVVGDVRREVNRKPAQKKG